MTRFHRSPPGYPIVYVGSGGQQRDRVWTGELRRADACCLAINPSRLAVKRGLSYHGTHIETIVPYSLAFAACVCFTAMGVARMRRDSRRAARLRGAVTAILVLCAAVPLTPYSVDEVFDVLHVGLTSVLFSAALLFGAWLARTFVHGPSGKGLFMVQALAGSFVLVSQVGLLDLMIPSQFLFQVAFALLLIGAVRRLQASSPRT